MTAVNPSPRPYAEAAQRYRNAGWLGVLPLPPGRKGPPPLGWTGRTGAWPSGADVLAWLEDCPEANLGLRLPDGVVGIDVDAYGTKQGRATLDAATEKWGPLPATWRSTSRDDGVSGIYLFRVPEGLSWPGEVGPGVEVIQRHHRYAVAWPSIHPEGGVYRWRQGGVVLAAEVPGPDQLPELPASWVEGLTRGEMDSDPGKADLSDTEATAWLVAHGRGEPCEAVRATVDRYLATRFDGTTSRHDAARDATVRLFVMAAEGHTGAVAAVNQIGMAFRAAFDGDRTRDYDQGEWQRLYLGAVRIAAAQTTAGRPPRDPCLGAVELPESPDDGPEPELERAGRLEPDSETDDPAPAVIDVGSLTVEDAAAAAFARAVEAERRVQRARREAARLLDAEEAAKAFRVPPSVFTLTDELALPDEEVIWGVEEVLPAGANVLLTAQFKAGKTTLVTHLARCLADGERFLGRFDPAELVGRVALWNYEVSAGQYRRWLREAGIRNADRVAVLNLRGFAMPLHVPTVQDFAVRWLAERQTEVWVVDPFARAYGGTSENDNAEVGRFLDTLDVIKERAGVGCLVMPTHTGRAVQEVGQERARGATRLDDWPDARWSLNKDPMDRRYFSAMGRDVDVAEFQLGFDSSTRLLYATGEGSREEVALNDTDSRVLAILQAHPTGPLTTNEVARALTGKKPGEKVGSAATRAGKLLAGMEARGLVAHEDGGRNSRLWRSTGPRVIPEMED